MYMCISMCVGVGVCGDVNFVVRCMCRCVSAYFCVHMFVDVGVGVYGCVYLCLGVYVWAYLRG